MKFKTAYSTKPEIPEIVKELKNGLENMDIKALLYFSSTAYDPALLSEQIQDAFPGVDTFGCTTAGEIITGKMLENSVVAMAFSKEAVKDLKIEVLENISDDEQAVDKAFKNFGDYFGVPMIDIDYKKHIGIVLTDGMSGSEEKVMERIGDLTNVSFIGGSAGDDLKFDKTFVFANGKAYTNASVLALLKPETEFNILKTQSFKPSNKTLTVTKSNEKKRQVLEFNNKPAAKAYAEALNVPENELPDKVFKNPIGLMDPNNQPYVRSPRLVENDSIYFYCSIMEGMELHLLNSTNIIEDTQKALKEKEKEMGGITAIINFHCILRTLDLKEQNKTKEYGEIFKNIPTIGFSTYGESYIGHINQTSTMIIFK